jgi:hypothetical protein
MDRRSFLKGLSAVAGAVIVPSLVISKTPQAILKITHPELFTIGDQFTIAGVIDDNGSPSLFTVKSIVNDGLVIA